MWWTKISDSTNAVGMKKEQLTIHSECSCPKTDKPTRIISQNDLVSLDCWDEVFDPPAQAGVFRAHGNWQARLAGASVSVQQGRNTMVLPHNACLKCLRSQIGSKDFDIIIC